MQMDPVFRLPTIELERLQSEKLRLLLDLCARGHPYYRRRWSEAGVDVSEVRNVRDLRRLPLTPKKDLMADPDSFRLRLADLPLHERMLWEVIYTTGSTADPTPVYNTTHDYLAYLFQARRVAEISGIQASDTIANLFPLTPAPMGAFVRSVSNAYAAGASVFAALPGARFGEFNVHRSLDETVASVALHRATVLWGVPSFVRRVLMRAIELRADLRSVRMCAISGEASSPAMREELRRCLRTLGAQATTIFDRYGSTEMGAFAQCREEGDWHNPAPELQYHEVVDPGTGYALADGERGALAITHLDRRGTVLIRFLVGDECAVAHGPCPHCGRSGDRIVGPIVRTKDLVKVKGMLLNPALLLQSLEAVAGIDEFQVVIQRSDAADPYSMDELVVRVAVTARTEADLVAVTVADLVQQVVRVRPRIEVVSAASIYAAGQHTKVVRFLDRRAP
jgi:phenylacetate-CoA ligase